MTSSPSATAANPGPPDEKAPLQWGLVAIGIPVMALAFGGAALIGESKNSLGSALIALLTVITAIASPREKLWRATLVIGVATYLMLLLATATIDNPVLAGLAMFAVAFMGTLIGTAGQALSVAGMFISMAYLLPAATGIAKSLSIVKAAELGLVGVAVAFLAAGVIGVVRAVRAKPADGTPAQEAPADTGAPAPGIREQVRAAFTMKDATFRYALRRALALGVAMAVYSATEDHNVFWVMLTIFIVLQPDPASSWHKALSRSAGVMIGAIIVAGLGQFLPAQVIIGLGVVVLFVGLAWYQRSYTVFAAGISFTVVAIFGASDGQFANWAALRIADTVVGATIALLVGYLVFPDRWWRQAKGGPVSSPGSPSGSPGSP